MRTHSRSGSVDVEVEISRVVVRSLSGARRSVRNTKVEAAWRIAAGESHVQRRVGTLERHARAPPHIALHDLLVAGGHDVNAGRDFSRRSGMRTWPPCNDDNTWLWRAKTR
jgi:hypothetical protein